MQFDTYSENVRNIRRMSKGKIVLISLQNGGGAERMVEEMSSKGVTGFRR